MVDILNQALKDANYGVSGKNANPSIYYKITAYSLTRPDPTANNIQYSITVASYMNSGGSMGSGTPLDIRLQLSVGNYVICNKYLKQSTSWSGKGDSTATSTITLTGTAEVPISGTQTVKFLAYRPDQSGDVISSSNLPAGTSIGSGEVINSSYTMNFPEKQPSTYTVTYDANEGTNAPQAQTGNYGYSISITNEQPTRIGYEFVGWNTAIDGSGTWYYSGGDYINSISITLYAQWELITYNVNVDNTWAPCVIKVNVVGEWYLCVGFSEDFESVAAFNQYMYEEYGMYLQDNEDKFYCSYMDINKWDDEEVVPYLDRADFITWGDENPSYAVYQYLYIKSDNVKHWVNCAIKSCGIGEGYEYIGLTSDYYDLQDFDQCMYDKYGIWGTDTVFTAVQSSHYPDTGVPVDSIDESAWGGYNGTVVAWELYMKSDNVKQWIDCATQGL